MKLYIKKFKWRLYRILPWYFYGLVFRLVTFSDLKKINFKKLNVGKNSYIDPSVQIIGWGNVKVGSNTTISEKSWINVNFRDDLVTRLSIGNNCHIGRGNFFSVGPLIRIGDYGFTGLDCRFLGCGHNIDSPLIPYIASGLSSGGVVDIGVNCWLATSVTVMENVKIGHGTIVGAGSLVTGDLPPFSIAIGTPCKVIKRFDFRNKKWINIEFWTTELEEILPDEIAYLALLVDKHKEIPTSLVAASSCFGWL